MALTRPKIAQVNTVVTSIVDPITVLNRESTAANIDIGFVMNRGSAANVALFWDESAGSFVAAYTSSSGTTDANLVITSYADFRVGTLNISNVIADTMTVSGNITTTSGYFIGDGRLLSNVGEPDKIFKDASNVTVTSNYVNVAINSSNVAAFSSDGLSVSGNLRLLAAPLAAVYGGTGITSYAKGDILYASNTNVLSVLAAGSDFEFLQIDANGVPVWDTIDGGTYEGE